MNEFGRNFNEVSPEMLVADSDQLSAAADAIGTQPEHDTADSWAGAAEDRINADPEMFQEDSEETTGDVMANSEYDDAARQARRDAAIRSIARAAESRSLDPPDPITFTRTSGHSSFIKRSSDAPLNMRAKVFVGAADLKRRARELMPNHEGDEHIAEIDAFFERQGLHPKPVKILNPEELDEYRAGLAAIGYHSAHLDKVGVVDGDEEFIKGAVIQELGLGVAMRDPSYAGHFGGFMLLRGLVAHEKAHSTAVDAEYVCRRQGGRLNYDLRARHLVVETEPGTLLEEAYAEFKRAEYIRDVLGFPYGLMPGPEPLSYGEGDSEVEDLPPVYFEPHHQVREGPTDGMDGRAFHAAPMGYGLELLIEQRPELYHALNQSRHTQRGKDGVAFLLDTVKPGLFREIASMETNAVNAAQALRIVKDAIAHSQPWPPTWYQQLRLQ